MNFSGFDFERMGKILEQPARMENSDCQNSLRQENTKKEPRANQERTKDEAKGQLPLPEGYPYPELAAAPDIIDGWPVCRWFVYPERLQQFNIDRRGMGIRAEGLPLALRPCSLNGWIVRLGYDGKLRLERGPSGTSNQGICELALLDNRDAVLDALKEVGEI